MPTPGAKAPSSLEGMKPKAKALGYLDAKTLTRSGLSDDAGAGGGAGLTGLAGLGLTGHELGHFEEAHAGFEDGGVEEVVFGLGEGALGFFGEDGKHVDGLAGSEEVDLRGLAGLGAAAELHDRLHVDGLDEALEGHLGDAFHAGVGGADGEVDALDRGGVGGGGLG